MSVAFDKTYDAILAAMTGPGTQLEVHEAAIGGNTLPMFKNVPATMADFLKLALLHGDKEFIVYEGERYTFAQTYARAEALAACLQNDWHVAKGDRVVIAMRNYPEWIFAFMAIAMIGAIAVPLNAWWQAEEFTYALSDSDARLAIADEERASRLAQVPHEQRPPVLVVRPSGFVNGGMTALSDSVFESGAKPTPVAIDPEDDLSIMYTSGSTGYPKGAVSRQRGMVSAVFNYTAAGLTMLQITMQDAAARGETVDPNAMPQPVALLPVPLFHITGLVPILLVCFVIGRKLVIMHKWDVVTAFRLIEQEQVTYFTGVPTMSLELMQHPDRDKYDLSSLVDIGGGGAARPAEHVGRLKAAFPGRNPGIGYGLTETNGVGAMNSRESYYDKPTSTGRPTRPLVEMKIAGDDGAALPTGAVGEVCIRSICNVRGYWKKPEATAEAFTTDGWFRTGDLGYLDDEGYLFIVDRKKDIIIRGGENIACLEVESAIYHHPAVAEVAVFGLPDERLGEIVGAVVYLKPGERVDAEDLRDYLAQHLAAFKIPARIWLVADPLPKLGSGKIDKVMLRKAYRELAKAVA